MRDCVERRWALKTRERAKVRADESAGLVESVWDGRGYAENGDPRDSPPPGPEIVTALGHRTETRTRRNEEERRTEKKKIWKMRDCGTKMKRSRNREKRRKHEINVEGVKRASRTT